jgi:hypothetical protein
MTMPRRVEKTVYKYDELDDASQAKARDWWREAQAQSGDNFWSEHITDDFKEVLKACGFSLDSRITGPNGSGRRDVLYWSGFSSQGDGACFGASWNARDVSVAAMIADRPVTYKDESGEPQTCPHNAKLVPLLEEAANLARVYPRGSGRIVANDRYHSTSCENACADHAGDLDDAYSSEPADTALQEALESLAQDLAQHFYRELESEYEYMLADEQVVEAIMANDYEFTSDGLT